MFEIELYMILKEINSLARERESILSASDIDNHRVVKLKTFKKKRLDELEKAIVDKKTNQQSITSLENEYEKKNSEIEQAQSNLNSIFTEKEQKALDAQIANLQEQNAEIELELLNLMEKQENLNELIEEISEFKINIDNSIEEIRNEVFKESKNSQDSIKTINQRVEVLINQLPEQWTKKLLTRKNLNDFLTNLDNKHCLKCGTQIPTNKIEEVEHRKVLHSCNSCKRVILPSF